MAANPRYRYVYVVCAFLEVLFFGGLLFGWASLLFVLKQDGVFSHLCSPTTTTRTTLAEFESSAAPTTDTVTGTYVSDTDTCEEQDNMLNLVFSIASVTLSVGAWAMGLVNLKFGTRVTRLCAHALFLPGVLFTAFTSRDVPWLIFFGPSLMGVAGQSFMVTNMQFSILFTKGISLVVGLITGAYGSSSVVLLVVKLLHQQGVALRWQMITLAVVSLLTLVNTFFFLPSSFIYKPVQHSADVSHTAVGDEPNGDSPREPAPKAEIQRHPQQPLKQILLSPEYWLHVLWGAAVQLRHYTFHGILNQWLGELTSSQEEVSKILNVVFYIQTSAIVITPVAGFICDAIKRPFADSPSKKRRDLLPAMFPLALTSVLGLTVSVLMSLLRPEIIYLTIPVYVVYRSVLFMIGHGYIVSVFPSEYAGILLGLWCLGGGIMGLLQYGLYVWAETSNTQPVNYVLAAVTALSLCHPLYVLWSVCRREATPDTHAATTEENTYDSHMVASSDPDSNL